MGTTGSEYGTTGTGMGTTGTGMGTTTGSEYETTGTGMGTTGGMTGGSTTGTGQVIDSETFTKTEVRTLSVVLCHSLSVQHPALAVIRFTITGSCAVWLCTWWLACASPGSSATACNLTP
jgi:hypothetical protein